MPIAVCSMCHCVSDHCTAFGHLYIQKCSSKTPSFPLLIATADAYCCCSSAGVWESVGMAHFTHLRHQFSVGDRRLKFYNLTKRKSQLSNNTFFSLHSMILGYSDLIKEDNAPHWACKSKYCHRSLRVKNQVEQAQQ